MKTARKPQTQPVNCLAIIQARMGSTRLPGKTMAKIGERPMLWHVVQRARSARLLDEVVVATTSSPSDDPIATFCEAEGIPYFRGSEADVLDRFYQAAAPYQPKCVVRLTADCPLIDPAVIDQVVAGMQSAKTEYAANNGRYSFPEGLDTEAFTFLALERAWKEAKLPSEREHVTPYIRNSGKFTSHSIENDRDFSSRNYHWSVDSEADLAFARKVFAHFGKKAFSYLDVVTLLEKQPELAAINSASVINEGYYLSLYKEATTQSPKPRKLEQSMKLFSRAKQIIPGAAQTFSKSYTQHVMGVSPLFLQRGKGAHVWDVDGNQYIDYVQGLLANILGYCHPEVDKAVAQQLKDGLSFSLPHPNEILLAEKLMQHIPCAEAVRFGKNGSDATSGAIRAARGFTGRERVATCGYHGWQDWYIGATTRNLGVPEGMRSLTHTFPYNDLSALEKLLNDHRGEFAAIIMEPFNVVAPASGYLEGVKKLAHSHGALLIFDEICTGFRFGLGGAQTRYGVKPDMACFGKAMGNGFPISCVVGRKDVMQIFEEIFFSFTLGGEAASLAAALQVIEVLESTDAIERIQNTGKVLKDGFNTLARASGLEKRFECIGFPEWGFLKFRNAEGKDNALERTLFAQEAVKRGILLLVTHNVSAAHDSITTERTLAAYAEIFKTLQGWLGEAKPEKFLEGPIIQPVFKVRG